MVRAASGKKGAPLSGGARGAVADLTGRRSRGTGAPGGKQRVGGMNAARPLAARRGLIVRPVLVGGLLVTALVAQVALVALALAVRGVGAPNSIYRPGELGGRAVQGTSAGSTGASQASPLASACADANPRAPGNNNNGHRLVSASPASDSDRRGQTQVTAACDAAFGCAPDAHPSSAARPSQSTQRTHSVAADRDHAHSRGCGPHPEAGFSEQLVGRAPLGLRAPQKRRLQGRRALVIGGEQPSEEGGHWRAKLGLGLGGQQIRASADRRGAAIRVDRAAEQHTGASERESSEQFAPVASASGPAPSRLHPAASSSGELVGRVELVGGEAAWLASDKEANPSALGGHHYSGHSGASGAEMIESGVGGRARSIGAIVSRWPSRRRRDCGDRAGRAGGRNKEQKEIVHRQVEPSRRAGERGAHFATTWPPDTLAYLKEARLAQSLAAQERELDSKREAELEQEARLCAGCEEAPVQNSSAHLLMRRVEGARDEQAEPVGLLGRRTRREAPKTIAGATESESERQRAALEQPPKTRDSYRQGPVSRERVAQLEGESEAEQLVELLAQFYAHTQSLAAQFETIWSRVLQAEATNLKESKVTPLASDNNSKSSRSFPDSRGKEILVGEEKKLEAQLEAATPSNFAQDSPKLRGLKERIKMQLGADHEGLMQWLSERQDKYGLLKNVTIKLIEQPPNKTINVCEDGPKILVLPNVSDIFYCYTRDQWIKKLWSDLTFSPFHYPFLVLNILVFLFGTFGNMFVCLSVKRNHQLRNVTNYFIVNLAFADFLVILICLPATVVWDLTLTWFFDTIPCKMIMFLQVSSLIVLLLFVFEIYLAKIVKIFEWKFSKFQMEISKIPK